MPKSNSRRPYPGNQQAVLDPKRTEQAADSALVSLTAQGITLVNETEIAAMKKALEDQINAESDPYFATARLWDDGIIDPRETRTVLAISLSAAYNKPVQGTMEWGVFRH